MADLPQPAGADDSGSSTTVEPPDRASSSGTPRWVKVFSIIGILLIVIFVSFLLSGGSPGGHGPGRH